jgi:hypothetical protein
VQLGEAAEQVRRLLGQRYPLDHQKNPSLFGL